MGNAGKIMGKSCDIDRNSRKKDGIVYGKSRRRVCLTLLGNVGTRLKHLKTSCGKSSYVPYRPCFMGIVSPLYAPFSDTPR